MSPNIASGRLSTSAEPCTLANNEPNVVTESTVQGEVFFVGSLMRGLRVARSKGRGAKVVEGLNQML